MYLTILISLFFPLDFFVLELPKLICEFQQNPLAINTLQLRLGWQFTSTKNEAMQSVYELEI
ncbi:MAG: hypothetical protein PHS59_16380 [Paludibacter sp.]|nr:hypothetical protein [Paludibacter sp.]